MTDPNYAAPQPGVPQPAAPQAAAADTYPGKGLGIAGLIVSIFVAIVGLIMSIVALNKSKKAGFKNVPAVIGIIIGILGSIAWIIFWVGLGIGGAALFGGIAEVCSQLGEGTHEVGGVTYTCG